MAIQMPHHERFKRNGKWYSRLLSTQMYNDSLKGYEMQLRTQHMQADLTPAGHLRVYPVTEWDNGTGAVDDPAMVYASLEHDIFCEATRLGLLPWKARFEADKLLFRRLGEAGAKVSRFWRVPVVMLNSQLVARFNRAD